MYEARRPSGSIKKPGISPDTRSPTRRVVSHLSDGAERQSSPPEVAGYEPRMLFLGQNIQPVDIRREPFSGAVDPHSAGNGSIMRLAPVVLFAWPDRERAAALAVESSRTTHGANEAVDACVLLSAVLHAALNGEPRESVLLAPDAFFRAADESTDRRMSLSPGLLSIVRGDYQNKGADAVRGSGYVTESLEAALWCFARTDCFRDAILAAANLGDDADTTAAVCGQVAGAFYGESAIPADWLHRLHLHGFIRDLADRLIAVQPTDIEHA